MSNQLYVYNPVGFDLFYDHRVPIKPGTVVRKTQPVGCPKNGTMGHCFIATEDGTFVGLRLVNSLEPIKEN